MSENVSLLRFEDGRLYWLCAGDDRGRDLREADVEEAVQLQLGQRGHRVLFAVPGADVRLSQIELSREERRHIDASLPYMLEESLAEDIAELHFAKEFLGPDRVAVATVRRAQMILWREGLASLPTLNTWLPEPLLLPWEAGQWTLVIEAEQVILRYGACEGTTVESALLDPLLMALSVSESPEAIIVYGADESADRALLPDALQDKMQWRRGGLGAALLLLEDRHLSPNLLQGEFAPRLPFERWWRQWRPVAALLLVALLVHMSAGWLDLRRLQGENVALREEIQSLYREVNPRGAVVDAEKQLRRQLAALGGTSDAAQFSALLEPLGLQLAAQPGAALASLNYSQRNGELRVNLLAPDFAAVERIRSALAEAGLSATLESSSRSGDRVRARLRIAGSAI